MQSWSEIEILFVTLAALAGLGILVLRMRFAASRRLAALVVVLACGGGLLWAAGFRQASVPEKEEEVPYRPLEVKQGGYVGSETCRSCHPREYATWHASYHRTMTQVPNAENVLGDFDDVELELDGVVYHLHRDGDLFWAEWDDPEHGPMKRPILMSTGSHWAQVYWYPTGKGRKLAIFPFVHYVPEDRWRPRRALFLRPPPTGEDVTIKEPDSFRSDERWNAVCSQCHTTNVRPDHPEYDTRASEFGIACEACHGPAAEHVRVNRDPARRYELHLDADSRDESIVHPAKLGHELSSQVCAPCHAVNYPKGDELWKDIDQGRTYRPGDDLRDTRAIVQPSLGPESLKGLPHSDPAFLASQFWSDGTVRVKGRDYNGLIDSPCYQAGELSCFSCHSMHQAEGDDRPPKEWANDQLRSGMRGNAACTQCHGELAKPAALEDHTFHAAQSTGSNCYNCHMPHTSYGLLKAIRSHRIESPSVATSVETGRPNGCNSCHLDRSLGWTADRLDEWYGIETPSLDAVHEKVPASIVWALSGDAVQRSLALWAMRWEPAREASGTDWMTPILARLLGDPYDSVRYHAVHGLEMQPGLEDWSSDYLAAPRERLAAGSAAVALWRQSPSGEGVHDPLELIHDPQGELPEDVLLHLLSQRDDTPIQLVE